MVRPFVESDTDAVNAIRAACTLELRAVYTPIPANGTAPASRSHPSFQVVAVDRSSAVVGIAECIRHPSAIFVQGLAVAPTHRRCGVARELLAYIASFAEANGFSVLELAMIKETGNVNLFLRLGFAVCREQTSERFVGRDGTSVTEVTLKRRLA